MYECLTGQICVFFHNAFHNVFVNPEFCEIEKIKDGEDNDEDDIYNDKDREKKMMMKLKMETLKIMVI